MHTSLMDSMLGQGIFNVDGKSNLPLLESVDIYIAKVIYGSTWSESTASIARLCTSS